jgi:uracil-DNA glycosylase
MLLVGEAWGEKESEARRPFVGSSGKELFLMLGEALGEGKPSPDLYQEAVSHFRYGNGWIGAREAWLQQAHIGMTNVLALRPPDNKLDYLCCKKTELPEKGKNYARPALGQGKYLQPSYFGEIDRLWTEIGNTRPNLIVALGNTASWGVINNSGIGGIRGTITEYKSAVRTEVRGKCLPTYHPAGVMRNWSWRTIVVADLMKAWRESATSALVRPTRDIIMTPTIDEITSWTSRFLANSQSLLSVDIETKSGQITCIGFGSGRSMALVIPFGVVSRSETGSYWSSPLDEERAWELVSRLLASPNPKVFQNGVYDLQYLTRIGLTVNNCLHDTMLMHHSIFPEMQKGLGFLGSIYTNEPAWKLMRKHKGNEVGVKADE